MRQDQQPALTAMQQARRGVLLAIVAAIPGSDTLRLCGKLERDPQTIEFSLDRFSGLKVTFKGQEVEIPAAIIWQLLTQS